MRRLVTPLLAAGSALLVAALIWPTDRVVLESPTGAVVPLLDIWLWGRVRSPTELRTTEVDGSMALLGALVVAVAVVVAAAWVWLSGTRRHVGGRVPRRRAVAAAVAVAAAFAVAAVALNVEPPGFGWFAPGAVPPTFVRTTVAAFPTVALGLWLAALVAMLGVLLRRRGGPDEGPGETSPG